MRAMGRSRITRTAGWGRLCIPLLCLVSARAPLAAAPLERPARLNPFITPPFPRLASTSPRQVVRAVEGHRREAVIVDPRLTREVTLQFKGIALSDLCDHLRDDTGIELSAGPSVADEKVTVSLPHMS